GLLLAYLVSLFLLCTSLAFRLAGLGLRGSARAPAPGQPVIAAEVAVVRSSEQQRIHRAVEVHREMTMDGIGNRCDDGADLSSVVPIIGIGNGNPPRCLLRPARRLRLAHHLAGRGFRSGPISTRSHPRAFALWSSDRLWRRPLRFIPARFLSRG